MMREDLLEAIGAADDTLLERSERRTYYTKKCILSVTAACLALIICAGIFMRSPQQSPAEEPTVNIDTPEEHTVPKINTAIPLVHQILPGKINRNVVQGNSYKSAFGISANIHYTQGPEYQFIRAITVEARVVEVLPDRYWYEGRNGTDSGYRILRLKILDVIVGSNVPQEIFYLLPSNLDPNLMEYDSLILNMKQLGLENYLMINRTQQRAETFSFMFGQDKYAPECGAFLAFKDGKLDTGLWEKDGWNYRNWGPILVSGGTTAHTDCISYPGKINRDLAQTKQAILDQQEYMQGKLYGTDFTEVVTSSYFEWPESKEALEYIYSFENGTFRQEGLVAKDDYMNMCFTRLIDGVPTDEIISITRTKKDGVITESVYYSEKRYFQAEIENLPDLHSVLENIEQYVPEKYSGDLFSAHFCGASGRYQKKDGRIVGLVTIYWGNPNYEEPKGPTDQYVLYISEITTITIELDGTISSITDPLFN